MGIDILNKDGVKVGEANPGKTLSEGVINEDLFYEVVKMQMANRRAGTASTKTKGNVSGGGRKPWKQKGTGRARSGSIRSPLWRHGGTVFGPHPRDYSYTLPRKVKKEALLSALRLRLQEGALKVFETLELKEPKTKAVMEMFKKVALANALVVIDSDNRNLKLAVRNLKDFKLIDIAGLNVYDILNYDNLVMTKSALEKVEASVI
ncbi:MAG: 50S ribosomal protein L4 [Deltaproteobacteria bacterium]|nr:50S ribosomal protein L4 [Deltaproteobacteria bacterium]